MENLHVKVICITIVLFKLLAQTYAQEINTSRSCMLSISSKEEMLNSFIDKEEYQEKYPQEDGSIIVETSHNLSKELDVYEKFGIKINVKWYDDEDAPNAFATTMITDYSKQNGTVALGVNLAKSMMQNEFDYIIYHEVAHILTFKYMFDLRQKHKELFADYFAGFMIGWEHADSDFSTEFSNKFFGTKSKIDDKKRQSEINKALEVFFGLGDYYFNSPEHHGTPKERIEAVMNGYETGYYDLKRFLNRQFDLIRQKIPAEKRNNILNDSEYFVKIENQNHKPKPLSIFEAYKESLEE